MSALDLAENPDAAQRWLADTWSDGAPGSFELEAHMHTGDGRPVVALVSGTLVRDPAGAPLHYLVQYLDVTERIAAQIGARRQRGQARRGTAGRAARQLGMARRRRPRHLVRRALPHPRAAARGHVAELGPAPRARPPRGPRAGRPHDRAGRRRRPRLEPRPPDPASRRRRAARARPRGGRPRRRRRRRLGPRHLPGRHRVAPRRGRAARRRAALPPRLRRLADRDGADRPRGPLAAPEPRARPDGRPHRGRPALDDARRAQPSRGHRARPPADPRAARGPPPQLRDREAHDARGRARAAPARARVADARRR